MRYKLKITVLQVTKSGKGDANALEGVESGIPQWEEFQRRRGKAMNLGFSKETGKWGGKKFTRR